MMRWLILFLLAGCVHLFDKDSDPSIEEMEPSSEETVIGPLNDMLDAFSPERLRDDVNVLADDDKGGRIPGSAGHLDARDYILAEMEAAGLVPLRIDGSYVQTWNADPHSDRLMFDENGDVVPNAVDTGYNLIGAIPGSDPDLANEYIVMLAHYDHLGVDEDGNVFNGAFDNATGVAMGLEIARTFISENVQPKRTIVFIFTDEEESGLDGAKEWLLDPHIPDDEIICAFSVDPVGRPVLPDFWPLAIMGLERSPALLARWREMAAYAEIPVFFIHRDAIPVFSSDQDRFYVHTDPIAAAWYTNPGMSFYHTVDDTPITIDYRVLLRNTRFLAQVLYDLASDDQRYPYEGEPPMDSQMAKDAQAMFLAVMESSVISQDEYQMAEFYASELQRAIDADDINVLGSPEGFFYGAAYFVLFELTYSHPGEVPPPFPGEE